MLLERNQRKKLNNVLQPIDINKKTDRLNSGILRPQNKPVERLAFFIPKLHRETSLTAGFFVFGLCASTRLSDSAAMPRDTRSIKWKNQR
jgi:hypothetical protein